MSTKPPSSFTAAQFDQPLMYPLYMTSHDHLQQHAAGAAPSSADHHQPSAAVSDPVSFFSRSASVADPVQDEGGGTIVGISFAERFKRWSFEQERSAIANSDHQLQSFNMGPLLTVNNEHNLLSNATSAAAGGVNGGAGSTSADMREVAGGHVNFLGSLGSSVGESCMQSVGFLPLSNSNAPYPEAGYASTEKPHYSTAHTDMEILRVNQAHNTASGSVHLFEDIPSPLTHQNVGLSAASNYNIPYTNSTHRALSGSNFNSVNPGNNHRSQLLSDNHHHLHQWGPSLRTSSAGSHHPHAELLLLPGVAESVVEASPSSATTHSAALSGSNKLDLLHVSSLHDKQATGNMLPLQGIAAAGGSGRMPTAAQMWHIDKLEMTVGLGLQNNPARTTGHIADFDHYASTNGTQSGLSLFLQSSQQRSAQTALTLDAARYSTRSASGSLGVLRNSKYLKAAQQLLNEFCSVCRDGSGPAYNDAKSSTNYLAAGSVAQNNFWNAASGGSTGAEEMDNIAAAGAGDHGQLISKAFFSTITAANSDKSNLYQLKNTSGARADQNQLQSKTPATETTSEQPPAAPAKQLPADERCHLQMRKARLVAMVEELDRRYQQYRDHMQLIVTSFESATGMGGAAPYTTLARRAMSRQFRGLRDAIGEHISAVCRMLGEEVSSVPILSRGETPRLRLVDQRLRHQRSLQQIGMLPQQQAWRPQRGLPERSVSVLRAWLFEHFLHPYPKDSEKAMLARLTGLSRNQVSNWFINARVRLWKPMIEEMYVEESKALEMQQSDGGSAAAADHAGDINNNSTGHGGGGAGNGIMMVEDAAEEQQETCMSVPTLSRLQVISSSCWAEQHQQLQLAAAAGGLNDLNSFIHFHSSAARPAAASCNDSPSLLDSSTHNASSSPLSSWMSRPLHLQPDAAADMGIFSHHHHNHHHHHHAELQAAALMQAQAGGRGRGHDHHSCSSSSSSISTPAPINSFNIKNGVSLTLGLQQPPPHSTYTTSLPSSAAAAGYHGRTPSEALLF